MPGKLLKSKAAARLESRARSLEADVFKSTLERGLSEFRCYTWTWTLPAGKLRKV